MNIVILISVAAAGMSALVLISAVAAGGRAEKKIQRTLPLLLLAITASAPGIAHADSLWLITSGRSYHLNPSINRGLLNQDQHTAGIAWQHGPWQIQLSHMTDSFSCPSDEAAGLYRRPLLHQGVLRGGLEAGLFVAHRCVNFRSSVSSFLSPGGKLPSTDPRLSGAYRYFWACAPGGGGCEYTVWHRAAGAAQEHWIIGAMPAAYLQVWRLRLEVGVIVTGPMDGAGDAVLYGQLSIKLAAW